MKILLVTVGLPRSGKSTWAKDQGVPIVNKDSIRLALHGERFLAKAEDWVQTLTSTFVDSLLVYGRHDVIILDECNVTKRSREKWVKTDWETIFVVFKTPYKECRRRALNNFDFEILPIIDRMANKWENVEMGDGDTVWEIY